jgi:hypothetical protein
MRNKFVQEIMKYRGYNVHLQACYATNDKTYK